MSIRVTSLSDADPSRRRNVAVGVFDGVHVGHREVVKGADTVLTFDPHPLSVLRPESAPKLIMPVEMKRDILAGLGVEEMVVIEFDEAFSRLSADEFIDYAFIDRLNAERVSVGENFKFGRGAEGDASLLAARGEFETSIAPLVEVDGETVSSTRIRTLIEAGRMEEAARCLGGPFMIEAEVVGGDRRGRELGFPTANLQPRPDLVRPPNGVYAAFANEWPAAVNVGVRPTFEDSGEVLVEAHLIDRNEDLYGKRLRVAFLQRLRNEAAYPDAEALVEQMRVDVDNARKACAEFTPA